MKFYRPMSLLLFLVFSAVGLVFLLIPDGVLSLFNSLSPPFRMTQSPLNGPGFYLILAVGYMYLVAVLAFEMYRHPGNALLPLLLAHAKFASSLISLGLFLAHEKYLVYAANFVVDGAIGAIAFFYYLKIRSGRKWASS